MTIAAEPRKHLIVVGNGMAGMRTVEELLKHRAGQRYRITVFGAEPHVNYNRIMLSSVLAGGKSIDEIVLHPRGWYLENDIRLFTGDAVTAIDRAAKTVTVASGLKLSYDRLLIATGSRPLAPPIPGIGLPGVCAFRDIADVNKMLAAARTHKRAGRIGRAGMGPFSLTGQPNAMGGREVGGLANQLAAHMAFAPDDIDRLRRFWKAPAMATEAGHKAVDLFDASADGRVKAVWIAATNPAASMPRAGRVREALTRCPLVIVSDAWPTDTSALAHVVLPSASWAEKNGTVTNSERCISRQRAFRAPPGEARPDWWMFVEVARRMGFETAFSYSGPADIFREHAALSAFENDGQRLFDIGALADLDDAAYDKLSPTQWPCPRPGPGREAARRLFADGVFPAPDGRARMIPLTINRSSANGDYPLILNTGRIRDQWHTMTRTGRVPHLMTHIAGPWLTLHPSDAAPRGIEDGGLARIESPHGSAVLRTAVDETVRPGNVFVPMHWTDQYSSSGPIDRLVHAATDAVSGQPDLKGTRVQVAAVAEAWRGRLLLLRERDLAPRLGEAVHWFKVPVAAGLGYELSGLTPLAEQISSERDLRILLQVSEEAELISYSDPKKQEFRYAALTGGRLEACVFFAAPRASFPESRQAERRLGETIEPARQFSLLAGAEGDAALAGKTVCACFSVEESAIRAVICGKKLTTVAEIGAALRAGTNCGSCIPELKQLLAAECARLAAVA
jgi:assimilatory nitrate reductase catalytic subunit